MNNHLIRAVAALVVGGLVATACGDGDDSDRASASGGDAAGCDDVDLSNPPDEPVTIRFGRGSATEDPAWLQYLDPELAGAEHYGTWYTVEATEFEPPDRLAAFQAGDLDAGTISTPQLFTAVGQGLPLAAVASIARVTEDGYRFPYLALDSSDIDAPEDLEGATIGIIAPNTATEHWVRSAVAAAGLDPERDVETVSVPPPNAEETLRSGQVDVQIFTEAFGPAALEAGGVHEVFDALTGPGFEHELLDVFFGTEFIEQNPEAFCAWRADYQAAMASYLADRQAAGQVLIDNEHSRAPSADVYAATPDVGREPEGRIDLASVDQLIDDMVETGALPEGLDVRAEDVVVDGYSLTS